MNGNHDDWRVENLAPICHFCHLARHPAQPGFGRGEFPLEIVWWPELTQAAIMAFSWSIFWLRALAQQDDDVAGKVGACLNGVSNEISRRTRQGREAGGARLPADLLSAAGEEEPAHWQSLRFLPVEIRSSGQRWQSAELHRFLAGGFDRFPLVSVVDAEIENLSFWLLKLVGAMLTGGEEA